MIGVSRGAAEPGGAGLTGEERSGKERERKGGIGAARGAAEPGGAVRAAPELLRGPRRDKPPRGGTADPGMTFGDGLSNDAWLSQTAAATRTAPPGPALVVMASEC